MAIYDREYKYDAEMENVVSSNKIRLWINGREIPRMTEYSYFDLKSYFKSPQRSANGRINNLNSYATFLTPSLKFYFEKMPVGAYRVLMKMIKEFNEFIVTAYDIVDDVYVTRKMYFEPKNYPSLFSTSLETKMINKETFIMHGTNEEIEELSLIYNSNGTTPVVTSGVNFHYGEEIKIGSFDPEIGVDPNTFTKDGFKLEGWVDDKGNKYFNGEYVTFTTNKILYANWVANDKFILTLDYQGGEITPTINTKEVQQGQPVGELPKPLRNGYVFSGWFTRPNKEGGDVVGSQTIYGTGNKTIYAHWVGVPHQVIYDKSNEQAIGTMTNTEFRTGELLKLKPNEFVRNGYEFYQWENQGIYYKDGATIPNAPDKDLKLYAVWKQQFELTYTINNKDISIQKAYYVDKPITPVLETGEEIGGWYTDIALQTPAKFPMELKENTNLYAKKFKTSFNLVFNSNTGNVNEAITKIVKVGEIYILPQNTFTAPSQELQFKGWDTDKTTKTPKYKVGDKFTMPSNDVELFAIWGV